MDAPPMLPRSSRMNKTIKGLPVHCLSEDDIRNENNKGIYSYFHAPENRHSRYMASITAINRGFLREVERPAPFTIKPRPNGIGTLPSARPASAPAARSQRLNAARTSQQSQQQGEEGGASTSAQAAAAAATIRAAATHTTSKGVPCYSIQAPMEVDILEGRPLSSSAATASSSSGKHTSSSTSSSSGSPAAVRKQQPWRVAKVVTQPVAPSRYGHGEAGTKAFHQDYRYYKYFGFAGRGAKTSWASNPKLAGKGGILATA